jgi:hypothetical protein
MLVGITTGQQNFAETAPTEHAQEFKIIRFQPLIVNKELREFQQEVARLFTPKEKILTAVRRVLD